MKITLENFSEHNRDRHIGNSLYRICRNEYGMWYILEAYNDGKEWARAKDYYNKELSFVIDKINSFSKEKEIVNRRFYGIES